MYSSWCRADANLKLVSGRFFSSSVFIPSLHGVFLIHPFLGSLVVSRKKKGKMRESQESKSRERRREGEGETGDVGAKRLGNSLERQFLRTPKQYRVFLFVILDLCTVVFPFFLRCHLASAHLSVSVAQQCFLNFERLVQVLLSFGSSTLLNLMVC